MDAIKLGCMSSVLPFTATDGIKLNGFLSARERRPKACMIFIHGMNGSAFSNIALCLAKFLPRGIALFSFNNRGHGMVSGFSKYVRGKRKRVIGGTSMERFEDCIFDIKGAIDALSRLGYKNFILCGHSTGCQKAAYYQYKTHDGRVKGIVLVAPCDDYNLNITNLGKNYSRIKTACERMIRSGKGNELAPCGSGFSAQRFESVINPKRAEARMFNYDGDLKEFGAIKTPILAVFGDQEENTIKNVEECLILLEDKTSSVKFSSLLVSGANHSFDGKEMELVNNIKRWTELI